MGAYSAGTARKREKRLQLPTQTRSSTTPDSKSGRKTIILNVPALSVLNALDRVGPYVVPGDDLEQPRHDLKRSWDAVAKRAGLTGVGLHALRRRTYASFGAGGGLGLPVIGRLLGHA